MSNTILYVTDHGDPSVGIPSQGWAVECPFEYDKVDEDTREYFRNQIYALYLDFTDNMTVDYKEEIDAQERAYLEHLNQMEEA